ncbi:hypothetical protein DPMN_008870 [Dreissena polymorpha]|uniref:Uncharacterized protein n=1 Tax=Dreissena polymorpha TaxID=45954 RepID=A0A9D4N062_DREPO|nr:hypothetical protein DPMN_008870 [Dreissena polymorpha]
MTADGDVFADNLKGDLNNSQARGKVMSSMKWVKNCQDEKNNASYLFNWNSLFCVRPRCEGKYYSYISRPDGLQIWCLRDL